MKKETKEFDKIPVTRIQRASKFIATGAKIGTNYLKHYSKRLVNPETTRDELHDDNARDTLNGTARHTGRDWFFGNLAQDSFLNFISTKDKKN